MVRWADAVRPLRCDAWNMTVSERIETQSFAYDEQFPPDVAAGLPLSAARRRPAQPEPPIRRALLVCVRVVSRRR
jgi:hypothetical protein